MQAKSYPVFEISKIEIKSEECAQDLLHLLYTTLLVIINCGKSDILKGKQVSLEKRFSNKFSIFTTSMQLPFVTACHKVVIQMKGPHRCSH